MTLTDTGAIVAVMDRSDQANRLCAGQLRVLSVPLLTTTAVLAEVFFVLAGRAGWHVQRLVFDELASGRLLLADLTAAHLERIEELMGKYADVPMDFADATLVALAEERGLRRIFTLDSDFRIYRLNGRQPFDVVPGAG